MCELHRATACGLGTIERDVRPAKKRVRIVAIARIHADPDADAYADLVSVAQPEPARQPADDGAGDLLRVRIVVELLQHQHELVAAQPRQRVDVSQAARYPARHAAKQIVTCIVTEAVIDELESVQVEVEHRAPSAVPAGPLDRMSQPQRKE